MSVQNEFCLKENGFVAEAFEGDMIPVLDEGGGLGIKPEYLIVIRNIETNIAYRLTGIAFLSTYEYFQNTNSAVGNHRWTDAHGRAIKMACKVEEKGVVDLNLWKPFVNPEPQIWTPPKAFIEYQKEKKKNPPNEYPLSLSLKLKNMI